MKAQYIKNTFYTAVIITLLFAVCIAFDLIPWLRGPAPFPESWQWPYAADFSVSKVFVPLALLGVVILYTYLIESYKKVVTVSNLLMLVTLTLFFHLGVLFFSRGGLNILLQRIIDPGFSGYFTAATNISHWSSFLSEYHQNMSSYYTHPRAHPPGWILFHYLINQGSFFLVPFFETFLKQINPSHELVNIIWSRLTRVDQMGALISVLAIPFLAAATLIPVYGVSRFFTDERVSLRISVLSGIIPSIILFTPLPDVLFPLICFTSFYLLLLGMKQNATEYTFLSGVVTSIAILCGLNILPFVFFMGVFVFLQKNHFFLIKPYSLGVLLIPLILYLVSDYQYFEVFFQAMHEGKAPRDYLVWMLFNLLDFFIYSGIPLSILFFSYIYNFFVTPKKIADVDKKMFYSLNITILALLLSGFTRGEVGRLWVTLMPLLLLTSWRLLKEFSLPTYLTLVALLGLQIIFMQGYWVSLW